MNIDILQQHAEKLVRTPADVAKLRQLILSLAVQGKLVIGTAWNEWSEKSIGDVASLIQPGFACSKEKQVVGGYLHIRMNNISITGTLDLSTKVLIEPALVDMKKSKLRSGDLLFNNTNSQQLVGKTCIIEEDFIAAWSNHITLIRFNDDISSKFVVWVFTYLRNSGYFANLCTRWINQAAINTATLKSENLRYPPLAEQERIVARVDELMGWCDALEAQLRQRAELRQRVVQAALAEVQRAPSMQALAALLDPRIGASAAELRQMILSLAVQGKLVAQNDDDEPAQEYFWRLSNKNRKTNLYQSTIKDSNYELPKNWVCVLFGDLMINRDGERIPVNRDEREQKEKIYDYYGASGVIDKIDDYLFDKPLLLIGEDGANLVNRSSPIAFIARGKYWVNNHAHVLDATDEVLLKYMEIYINSIDLKPYITGTAQPKMNQAKMNSIPVFLPPLAEQERIVARVDELMALVDRLEALQERADAVGEQVLAGLVG